MKPIFRFGGNRDFDFVSQEDRSIAPKVIEWKLNHEEIILSELNEEIVGYLRIEYLWSKYSYIGLIMVNPAYQRQGIGKGMLNYLDGHLKSKDT